MIMSLKQRKIKVKPMIKLNHNTSYKTSRLVFPSEGVWSSRRTLLIQSKTKLELVNRVISAEELEIRTLPFSSDSTFDTIAYSLMKTR